MIMCGPIIHFTQNSHIILTISSYHPLVPHILLVYW